MGDSSLIPDIKISVDYIFNNTFRQCLANVNVEHMKMTLFA